MRGLKYHRITRELTQGDVAKVLGVSQSLYSRWEAGSTEMKQSHMVALAKFFGITVDDLL